MIPLSNLKTLAQKAYRVASKQKDIREVEVFASATDQSLCRLHYTSGIPCHGVEEPKSSESWGFSIHAIFTTPDGPLVGFGGEARDFSLAAIRRVIEKARHQAVPDPDFLSIPRPAGTRDRPPAAAYHDPALMDLSDEALVQAGWQVINEGLREFAAAPAVRRTVASTGDASTLGLILSGDVSVYRQRIALISTYMPKVRTDESAFLTSAVTAMVERDHAKGTGYAATTRLKEFNGGPGAEAARQALRAAGGKRVPTGRYTVVLGPQPINDLMVNLILPSLSADAFYSERSAFLGHIGRPVASPLLSLYDDGAARGLVGTRGMTCEGLPTGRTALITRGMLTGVLSNHYETARLQRDPHGREKLGAHAEEIVDALVPRNGFRVSARGGRQFDVQPGIAATNIVIEAAERCTNQELLRIIDHGLYIGRIWYTYAMNGLRTGDFTCTVVGDSFVVRDGRLAEPLQPNTLRITGNIRQLLRNIMGISSEPRPIVGWAAEEVVYAPEIAVRDLSVTEIAQYMESV